MPDQENLPSTESRSVSRRKFLRLSTALLAGGNAFLAGCASLLGPKSPSAPHCTPAESGRYDYIVVGSGAGGGPLAANLAVEGFRVLLLEAGGEDQPCDYEVPAFHARVSEHEDLRWDFFVRHYADETRQAQDPKYCRERRGVLYPRAGTLGGCTAHNAMITVYPHNSDWDEIAQLTGDESWSSGNMRQYFERLEENRYASRLDFEGRHGFRGWLPVSLPDPRMGLEDPVLSKLLLATLRASWRGIASRLERALIKLKTKLDPNDWRFVKARPEGLCAVPLSTDNGQRAGAREFIQRVRKACPANLEVRTHALASRILLDDQCRAIGVEYLDGPRQYRADPRSGQAAPAKSVQVLAAREVIVCGGAFNTPQLLKLSGIGPKDELKKHGIAVKVDLPGVGANLQDRYEVCVVTRLKENIPLIEGMQFRCPGPSEKPDPQFEDWLDRQGPYTANGAVVSLIKRSMPEKPDPDLLIFGLIGDFHGYFPGYSKIIGKAENLFSWAILKAHTHNRAGKVTLKSADPRDTPDINFHYFSEGSEGGDDLDAVVAGVEMVRSIIGHGSDVIAEEILPGPEVKSRDDIRRFVEANAWGHHASCSCKMGPENDRTAVVDSRFRVRGTQNLRIVDASVFPRIPGFFIVSAIYMISEKAKDAIVEDAKTRA